MIMDRDQLNAFTEPLFRSLEPTSFLWHYTDTQGLEGIVHNRTIRLSHPNFLNDPSELQYADSVYNEVLDMLAGCQSPLAQKFVSGYRAYEKDENSPSKNPFIRPFVASFCDDDDNLELWRQYGDDGQGFALGFRAKELQDAVEELNKKNTDIAAPDFPYIYRVLYTQKEQHDFTDKILKFWLSEFEKIHEVGENSNAVIYIYDLLRITLDFCTPFFKHPCYANEKENRLVLHGPCPSHHEAKFLAKRGYFKPYIDFEIGTDSGETFPLDTVMIGPTTPSPWSERSLQMFLEHYGLESTKIQRSTLPYLGNDKGLL